MPISSVRGGELHIPSAAPAAKKTHAAHVEQPASSEKPSFAQVLERVGKRLDEGTTLDAKALHGAEMSPMDLIAMQSNMYRYTETLTVAVRMVDGATSAAKTILSPKD